MMTSKTITVLYVDDEIHNLNSFKATFRKEFNVLIAGSAVEALEIMKKNALHIVITDQRMPRMKGKTSYPRILLFEPKNSRNVGILPLPA